MTGGVNMNVTTADCELLGRGPVQGSADSDSLAALVRQLCKQQQRDRLPGRRCTVACSRDAGLEIVTRGPQQQQQQQQQHQQKQQQQQRQQRKRPDDEGFESDEDLASLGSYEDPAKRKTGALVAGAASDSANSSGVSEDSDDADAASLKGQPSATVETATTAAAETYGLADVAFCHTDAAALPGIAVWVIKTRRTSTVGLEAIVVRGRDDRLQHVCRAYQEHSRRLKLEPKPWTVSQAQRRKAVGVVTLTATPEPNRYSLVQRTDTDGVTHIEVTSVSAVVASPNSRRVRGDGSPRSSIISISTPESPGPKTRAGQSRDDDDDEDEDEDEDGERPPQRPERRKFHKAKPENGGGGDDFGRQQKVVRGQFIRVNVNHRAAAPPPEPDRECAPATRPREPSSGKPSATASADRLWSTADYDRLDGQYEQHRRSARPGGGGNGRTRSRSTGPGRRQQHPLQLVAPAQQQQQPTVVAFGRYAPNVEQQHGPSFGTRFFGKLREMTSGNHDAQPATFRRRNSVGESVTANFYQYFGHHHHHHNLHQHQHQQQQQQQHQQQHQYQQHDYQRPQAKNGGNLKSVIKKNNQPYQHAYDEPKKVTFSAYATVQVVD